MRSAATARPAAPFPSGDDAAHVNRLLFSIFIIVFGLSSGYAFLRLIQAEVIRLPIQTAVLRKSIQRTALLFLAPVPIVGAVWLIRIDDLRMAALPFLCAATLFFGGFLAWAIGKLRGYGPRQIGALYCCGCFSNIAAMGSLVSFFFIGEEGFAVFSLYKLFEEVIYYGIGFPVAKYYGIGLEEGETFLRRIKKVFTDPLVLVAMSALAAGMVLNVSGLSRPAFYETVNAVFIPLSVFLMLFTVGMGMSFDRMGYLTEALLLSGIKFLAMPAVACVVAMLLGMQTIYGGLPLKAVLLGSSMPVAFNSVVAASLYELDLDLANSCWLMSTVAMVVVLPCLYFLLQHI